MKIVLTNAKIYTVNKNRDWADSLVIEDGKILYVGDKAGALAYKESDTQIRDMGGKMILPGFIEGHIHTFGAAAFQSAIPLGGLTSKEDVFAALNEYVEENPAADCYFGVGWLETLFGDKGPNKKDLDAITDKPMALISASCHTCWVNSKALEIAGITKDTPDPIPNAQFFMRDENGEPTGYCIENKPLNMIFNAHKYINMSKVFPCLSGLSHGFVEEGITTCAEVGTYDFIKTILNDELKPFIDSEEYLGRIICCGDVAGDPDVIEDKFQWALKWQKEYQSDKLRLNFFKVLSDGTIENSSAACPTPYPSTGKVVPPLFSEDQEFEYMMKAYANGLDYNIHAIGPDAVHRALMAAGRARKAGAKELRISMSHSQCVYDDDIELFGKYDVFANTTPVWIPMADKEMEDALYALIQSNAFPLKRMKDSGARIGFGSDFPTDPRGFNVFNNIECGITRQPIGMKDFYITGPDERLTLDDMIAGYTINNAYQIRMEDKIGSIEVGKYADLIVLDKNLFEIEVHDIHNVKVIETIFNGDTCFKG